MFILGIFRITVNETIETACTLKSLTINGKVAMKSITCRSAGRKASNCSKTGANSGDSNLSASSITKTGQSLRSRDEEQ